MGHNPIMKFFSFSHLKGKLFDTSKPICNMAIEYNMALPDCPEKSAGLRKLLEAKDCFVRAAMEGAE